jgi:hypothetical protein
MQSTFAALMIIPGNEVNSEDERMLDPQADEDEEEDEDEE